MPVMVVGVEDVVGAHAGRLLASGGGEVRVFVQAATPGPGGAVGSTPSADPQEWRRRGCKVAHGFLDDEAHVESALEQVHTVLLLLGRPTDDPQVHTEHVATVISAAIGAGCRRLVLLSDAAVTEPAGNPWLEALAEAEDLAADAPLESIVLRTALVYGHGDPLTVALAAGALGPDPAGAHWPIPAEAVAVTAVTADADRQLDTSLHVLVDLAGPARLSTAALASALAARVEVPADPGGLPPLPDHAVDLLGRDVPRPEGALGAGAASVEELSRASQV